MNDIKTNSEKRMLLSLGGESQKTEMTLNLTSRKISDAVDMTLQNKTVKIDIVSMDKKGRVEIPVRVVTQEVSITQYMFLVLAFNFYTNA